MEKAFMPLANAHWRGSNIERYINYFFKSRSTCNEASNLCHLILDIATDTRSCPTYRAVWSPERTAANIIRIMDTLHQQLPHTKLFVQTIFPTDRQWMVSRIQETNNMIRKNVNHKAFTLIDTHALFADDKDRMKKELTVDGVHLNEQGYGVWVNCLKAYFK